MGQKMAELFTTPARATDANGENLSGAKWFFYQTGTLTPQSVFTTAALSTAHLNPVVADAAGKFPAIFFDTTKQYRGILRTADEATVIYDLDPINAGVLAQLGANDGSTLVGFQQAGTGAVARTAQAKMRDIVSVKDFGAVGDGVTDDLAAMQAAHNTGKIVYYPKGTYKFSGQLTIATGGIIGAGKSLTNLNATDTSANAAIKYTGAFTTLAGGLVSGLPTFHDFTLNGNALKTGNGAGLQFESATGSVDYIDIRGVQVSYFPINVDFVKASLWKMIGCDILGHTVAGVRVNNTFNNDAGDSVIMGNNFVTSSTVAPNILHITSGGLKVIGNKMLGGGYGYQLQYTGIAETSVLIIANNSIENFSQSAISLTKISGGLTSFKNVQITNNEIAVALATPSAFLISSDGGTWLQSVIISGNVLQLPGVTNSFGIDLVGVTALAINGNTFRGNGGTAQAVGLTSCTGVSIGANVFSNLATAVNLISCADAAIGTNVYNSVTTQLTQTTPGTGNTFAYDSQRGTTTGVLSVTATTIFTLPAHGALYEIYAYLANEGITYQSAVRAASDGLTVAIVGGDAAVAGMLITFSGLNVRVTQNTGATQTVSWAWRRIA